MLMHPPGKLLSSFPRTHVDILPEKAQRGLVISKTSPTQSFTHTTSASVAKTGHFYHLSSI